MTFLKRKLTESEYSSIDFKALRIEAKRIPPKDWTWAVDERHGAFFTHLHSDSYEAREGEHFYVLLMEGTAYHFGSGFEYNVGSIDKPRPRSKRAIAVMSFFHPFRPVLSIAREALEVLEGGYESGSYIFRPAKGRFGLPKVRIPNQYRTAINIFSRFVFHGFVIASVVYGVRVAVGLPAVAIPVLKQIQGIIIATAFPLVADGLKSLVKHAAHRFYEREYWPGMISNPILHMAAYFLSFLYVMQHFGDIHTPLPF